MDARKRASGVARALTKQRGSTLVEFGLTMILLAPLLYFAMEQITAATTATTNRVTANHLSMIGAALERYQREHYASLLDAAQSGPVTITTAMLRNTGNLPASVADASPYGQTYVAGAQRAIANGQPILQVMLVGAGGNDIPDKSLRDIAGQVKGGGYISRQTPAVAQGAAGSWQVPLAPFGLPPGPGRPAMAMFFNDAGLMPDYLYRNAVAGHPEVNTMNTAINMNANDVNNARDVRAQRVTATDTVTAGNALEIEATDGSRYGGWYMQDNTWLLSIDNKGIGTGSDIWAGGTVSATNLSASNFISGQNIWAANQVSAEQSIFTPGRITAGQEIYSVGEVVGGEGLVTGRYLRIHGHGNAGLACEAPGFVSQDGFGALLECVGGVWKKAGGVSSVQVRTASGAGTRNAAANAMCTPQEKVTGGGGACTNGGYSWIAMSFPTGNGWHATCDGTSDRAVYVTAYAMCAN